MIILEVLETLIAPKTDISETVGPEGYSVQPKVTHINYSYTKATKEQIPVIQLDREKAGGEVESSPS